jgi:hypothetical protein
MSYCPKCGNKVDETMTFCPRCGASLKMETAPPRPTPPPTYRRDEKSEKDEKQEKGQQQGEKGEKHEKGEFGYIGWLIGGVFIILVGILAFANATGYLTGPMHGAITVLVIGIAVIIIAVWLSTTARKRNPPPAAPVV